LADKNSNDIHESFNKMKKSLYNTSYDIKKYEYVDITNLILKEDKTREEIETLKKFYHLIDTIRLVVEDIGTQILRIQRLDFKDKNKPHAMPDLEWRKGGGKRETPVGF
jgi:hypothetical protein